MASDIYNEIKPVIIATGIAYLSSLTERIPTIANPLHTLVIGVSLVAMRYLVDASLQSSTKNKTHYIYGISNLVVYPIASYKIGVPSAAMASFSISLTNAVLLLAALINSDK